MAFDDSSSPSPEFVERFRKRLGSSPDLTFEQFMELALYDPVVGYYLQPRRRIGYAAGTDFYTASTSGAIFGELVAAAAVSVLGGRDPAAYTFVEIGAEPSPDGTAGGILSGVSHSFGATRILRPMDPIVLEGKCVVFSNELLDAQPCARYVRRGGAWREIRVALREGGFVEVEQDAKTTEGLPDDAPEGYRFDAPRAASRLIEAICRQPWTGAFIAFDYGKGWAELARETPAGTTRAYYRHTQSNDLLARPGQQDLTCHVCWDWLVEALRGHGFPQPSLDSQEGFFIRQAASHLQKVMAAEASQPSQRKRSLMQLLHPAHLGQKFQVLHAVRDQIEVSP